MSSLDTNCKLQTHVSTHVSTHVPTHVPTHGQTKSSFGEIVKSQNFDTTYSLDNKNINITITVCHYNTKNTVVTTSDEKNRKYVKYFHHDNHQIKYDECIDLLFSQRTIFIAHDFSAVAHDFTTNEENYSLLCAYDKDCSDKIIFALDGKL